MLILQDKNLYVDPIVHIKMNRLRLFATWIPLILQLKNLHNFHVITQTLNITSLHQYYEDINRDHNFQTFYILCFIETKIHHASIDVHTIIIHQSIHIFQSMIVMG
jgi:hypothetical protein